MQCSITVERDRASGNKMKNNNYKNPYRKDSNLNNIVDQLCTRLEDIKDQQECRVGMPTVTLEYSEAVRRYYAAFPALSKGHEGGGGGESPLQYYLPPPAWCRKQQPDMQPDWHKKKERRNSHSHPHAHSHSHKKNKRRCNSHRQESLPEWVTHEGEWDMDTQDPVKEFIRAIALDEGYGTCDHTQLDEPPRGPTPVPDWGAVWGAQGDLDTHARTPLDEELYAKFEAKFDRSLEALWAKELNTPDDEYQDLPIDFQDLLSSPSDRLFADPAAEKSSLLSLTESIWSNDGLPARESPCRTVDALHDRLKPLHLTDAPPPPPAQPPPPPAPRELESFALYEGEEIYDALSTVASTMRSFTALNHSRERSGFAEVPPRRARPPPPPPPAPRAPSPAPHRAPREDLLTAARTHFRPIKREADNEARYADGDTFDIRGDLEPVETRRSPTGGLYVGRERYLEYRALHTIDYTRLNLTEAQRCPDLDDPAFRLRFPVRQTDAAVQTDAPDAAAWRACGECGRAAKKMRPSAIDSIWATLEGTCSTCTPGPPPPPAAPAPEELSREWEELLSDISAAHAEYLRAEVVEETLVSADRKRRHSAALRPSAVSPFPSPPPPPNKECSHPHARFLHCCVAQDRPLTR